jgi:hypothetical protein
VGIVGVIGDKTDLKSIPLGGTLILSVPMLPSVVADACDASPAEKNILQLSAAMAMPCAFGKLSHRHGFESFEFGEFGRIEVVVLSGSMEERWRKQKLFGTASRCRPKGGI